MFLYGFLFVFISFDRQTDTQTHRDTEGRSWRVRGAGVLGSLAHTPLLMRPIRGLPAHPLPRNQFSALFWGDWVAASYSRHIGSLSRAI